LRKDFKDDELRELQEKATFAVEAVLRFDTGNLERAAVAVMGKERLITQVAIFVSFFWHFDRWESLWALVNDSFWSCVFFVFPRRFFWHFRCWEICCSFELLFWFYHRFFAATRVSSRVLKLCCLPKVCSRYPPFSPARRQFLSLFHTINNINTHNPSTPPHIPLATPHPLLWPFTPHSAPPSTFSIPSNPRTSIAHTNNFANRPSPPR
jgi:hypothetical protein